MTARVEWALPLDRMLTLDALRWAWRRVKENGGAAGGDRISIQRFGRQLEEHLLALADEVRAGTYQPGPATSVAVYQHGKERWLSILPVRDRVLQRAALDLLGPAVDPRFLPSSFGYRPGISVEDAVERLVQLRDRGFGWVVDADIEDCFGSLDHHRLLAAVPRLAPGIDPQLMELIARWVAGPPTRSGRPPRQRGIPLGAPLAPLLCNIYLHGLDRGLAKRRLPLVRYADDFIVACRSQEQARRALRTVEKLLAGLDLAIQPAKTRVTSFDDGFHFLGVTFHGTDYWYETDGKRIVIDELPPEWFHYQPEDVYG